MLRAPPYAIVAAISTLSASLHAKDASNFPPEFIEAAKKLKCRPLITQPFTWGVIKGEKSTDSGVFRCETEADRKRYEMASIAIFIREKSKIIFRCPRLIPKQEYGKQFRVWEPGTEGTRPMPLSAFQIMGTTKLDTAQMGPKNVFVKGYVLEHQIADSVGIHFYCHGSKWLASYYE